MAIEGILAAEEEQGKCAEVCAEEGQAAVGATDENLYFGDFSKIRKYLN